ncbi:biotin carboxylase N-terminal domain-containing protein [Desertimonas flava]|uniref:ATP-binding protein n=1 Tax=Desertimonas flava TaxID=2064846 RepID=UPI0018786DD6|nr:biotin carboxylase N-terminal domain-containing protein [Desertimonas flava]
MNVIQTLLIANRGEIACRIARTCRRLGIETVAVFSDADADALHAAACDHAVRLPGNAPADTYLRADLLLDAAARTGADAVHPGYGFLAESADFAAAVEAAGLTWIGPPPPAIAAMGSKIAAKDLMRQSGVPVLPEIRVGGGVEIIDAHFPLLVKASAGGGGRGMRIVRTADELDEAIAAASREAAAAFGDGEVFLERYVERGRHVEIQVLADTHGTVSALFERDCSVQRRHQKIIEEAPSPIVDEALRSAMSKAAVDAARAVGYVGAGTVEFLVDDASGEFHFLEMNTRLQVEHPVTEAVTGLDLVELQIRVAEGEPLPPEAEFPALTGHAIEARLTAEDPAAGYLPSTGRLVRFDVGGDGDVRVDAGVATGSVVSPFYDSMVAKVIAHGPTRAAAIRSLRAALTSARVAGVATNRDQLVNVLDHPEFRAGRTHTGFLDADPCATPRRLDREVAGAVVWFADEAIARSAATVMPTIPPGWRNNRAVEPTRAVRDGDDEFVLRRSHLPVILAAPVGIDADGLAHVTVERDGVREQFTVVGDGPRRWVDGRQGHLTVDVVPRHPEPSIGGAEGSLVATMPGAIRRVLVSAGDTVTAGQPVVVIEAMKMEHRLTAPADGVVVTVFVSEGDQVETGAALVELE